ncbi:hypothetical protein LSUE1_G003103 [Lachnellula suecica]|uniref:Uncharacterized protein n=1 Tax=Lachnellula suecica TaxID=602035 RepID=A0A8T9CEK6_9HELO|nr:hypothetical protein LSUE1_G003103 [Lachnellula suecica]
MKFATIASSLALCATFVSAADSSLNVASVISDFYPSSTPNVAAAVSTSLASALHSVDMTWTDSPAFTSAASAIYSAAPDSIKSSIEKSGYGYKEITAQDWYTKSVPQAQQTAIAGEINAIDSVAEKFVPTGTSTAGAAKQTGMAVAGVVGVVGLLAAL